jgi:hypothetical protein
VNTEPKVGGEGPGGGGPGEEGGFGVVEEGEGNGDCRGKCSAFVEREIGGEKARRTGRVLNILVGLTSLEVG